MHFSNLQARQTFALYLTYISALLKKCALEKHYVNPSSDLVLMFLVKASKNLSIPLEIEVSHFFIHNILYVFSKIIKTFITLYIFTFDITYDNKL